MTADEIRYLFAYDRWATARILAVLDGLDDATWTATQVVDERGLGGILVHHLGATQRWWHGLREDGTEHRPEREPLPTVADLQERWAAEWPPLEAWLATVSDDWLRREDEGVPFWRMLVHVVNHGTQHRSEAAAILTGVGRSPGDLDMIGYAEDLAGWTDGRPPSQQAPGEVR